MYTMYDRIIAGVLATVCRPRPVIRVCMYYVLSLAIYKHHVDWKLTTLKFWKPTSHQYVVGLAASQFLSLPARTPITPRSPVIPHYTGYSCMTLTFYWYASPPPIVLVFAHPLAFKSLSIQLRDVYLIRNWFKPPTIIPRCLSPAHSPLPWLLRTADTVVDHWCSPSPLMSLL